MVKFVLLFGLMGMRVFAGNEAGGDWVANRFRAKAFELLSILCKETELKKGTLKREEVLQLEQKMIATSVESKEDLAEPIILENGKIFLNRVIWSQYFNLELDVADQTVLPYLKLMKLSKNPLEGLDRSQLVSRHLQRQLIKLQIIADGEITWLFFQSLKPHAEGEKQCEALNKDKTYASWVWSLPSVSEVSASQKTLTTNIADRPGRVPQNFELWTKDKKIYSLFDRKAKETEEKNALGIVCIGRK